MNKEQLKKISSQQTERFFYSYSSNWRLTQMSIIERQLLKRYELFDDIVTQLKPLNHTATNEAIICQEISNGLFFEAIAIAIQSIEDLFALLNAGKTPLKFISGIITYNAGRIDNLLKQKINKEDTATLFYFPIFHDHYETDEQQKSVDDGLNLLHDMILELKLFYKQFRFFYNQYKHGLSVAFRVYCDYAEKQIEDHKRSPTSAYLHVFDNLSIAKLESNDVRVNRKVLMPYLTEDIQPYWQQLIKDDNLLRFVTSDERIEIEKLKSVVIKSRICISTFSSNLINSLKGNYPMHLQLPADLNNNAYILSFPKEAYDMAINKKIFI